MRWTWMARAVVCAATLLAWAGLAMTAAPAAAQMTGDLRYTRGYDLLPNPPVATRPTTFVLYGVYPTGCGVVEEKSVIDSGHVTLRLRSLAACPDSSISTWAESFSLGTLAAGSNLLSITLTMDRPDSGVSVQQGTLAFVVEDSSSTPPPPPPDSSSIPPPAPSPPLFNGSTISPWPATPEVPIALTVSGFAPFDCPGVSASAVIDTSHLALTLSRRPGCVVDTTRAWAHTFELGLQREGYHHMDLAITLEGDSLEHHVPVVFLVVSDSAGWGPPPPPDSLEHVLSPGRPNPFVTESRFSISLDGATAAYVAVYDILGRRVSTVFRGTLNAGTTELAWNGRHDDGSRATAGVYFYRLEMNGRVVSRRVVLLRPQ